MTQDRLYAIASGSFSTKGLTLPLISYGGSSLLVTCAALALLMRVDYERRELEKNANGGAHRTTFGDERSGGAA